ncbi:hypothetical protein PIB30_084522 [Stylosanthes scabra]|uniref:Uncharacterized protein n=1 Tax=Stylosanthes scabra TaxID=79078 RepID=A0ABU6SU06_9FABA|nr:hypothetical protein [Stylosanthes scabra]
MPRTKQTSKRTRNEDVVHMEPPSDHPLFKYFSRLDDLNNYTFNFSERVVISPRYLDIQLLDSQNFNQLSTILHDQGLIDFVQIKNIWYPELTHNMLRFTKSDHSKGLGYAYLWTRIFEYLGIDASGESGRRISQNNIIDERTIHHMGRGIEEGEEQQEPPPPQEQAPQEQAGPSEQPSMRYIMQVLQRIERKQARMDKRLHRIEQYMEIEEDEDEDQD